MSAKPPSAAQDGRASGDARRQFARRVDQQTTREYRQSDLARSAFAKGRCHDGHVDRSVSLPRDGDRRPGDSDLHVRAIAGRCIDASRFAMSARRAFTGAVPRGFRIMVMSAAGARGRAQVDADGSVAIEAQKEGRRIPRHELRAEQEQNQQRTRHPGTLKKASLLFPSSPERRACQYEPAGGRF